VVDADASTIRILVVNDHSLVRSLICGLLQAQSDFEVVGEATTGAEAKILYGVA
jgi:DNA-binding NarL/FixJ family response regulator